MKNMITTRAFVLVFLLALLACKKDETNVPIMDVLSVKLTQNVDLPYIVTSKDQIVFDVTISSNSDHIIKDATLSLDGRELHTASASATNEIVLKYSYKVTGNDVGKSLIFRLTVTDEGDKTVDKDFTVYVESAPAEIDVVFPSDAPSEIRDDESVDFNIAIVSENDLKYIKTFLGLDELTALTKETFEDPKEAVYNFNYQPTIADADKTLVFTIEIMDVMGNIVKHDYSLDIRRSQEVDFDFYADVNLGAQRSTAGPFFNANTGEVYVRSGAAAKSAGIDMVNYWSGSGSFYNIVSPTYADVATHIYTVAADGDDAIVNWATRNETFFKKISMTRNEFDLLASGTEIEGLYTGSSVAESLATGGLANNNVVVFRITSGKYGVMYIKSRSTSNNTGYLTIDIKVQK